jgi:hypothetical protein
MTVHSGNNEGMLWIAERDQIRRTEQIIPPEDLHGQETVTLGFKNCPQQ